MFGDRCAPRFEVRGVQPGKRADLGFEVQGVQPGKRHEQIWVRGPRGPTRSQESRSTLLVQIVEGLRSEGSNQIPGSNQVLREGLQVRGVQPERTRERIGRLGASAPPRRAPRADQITAPNTQHYHLTPFPRPTMAALAVQAGTVMRGQVNWPRLAPPPPASAVPPHRARAHASHR